MDKLKKVFSPGKDKDDEVMYGAPSKEPASATSTTQAPLSSTLETKPEAEQKDKGVLRQIFNPGGNKYSEQSYGTTATANTTMSDQLQKDSTSSEPLRGPETAQYNNDKVQQQPLDSTYTGTGSTTTGPSTMAREDNQDDVSNATFTARSYALGSGHSADYQQTSSHVDQATRATTDLGHTGDELSREHAGRRLDHSLTGAGTGGAGAGYVNKDELNEFMKHGRDPEADQATYTSRDQYIGSSADADPFERPGHEIYSADKGPSGVQSAGEMAAGHMPGEFPTDDGSDVHNSSSGIGSGAAAAAGLGAGAGAGVAGIAASRAYNDRNTTDSSRNVGSSDYPREQQSSPIQTTTNTMRSGSFSQPSQETPLDPKYDEKEKSSGFKGALAAATAAMGLGGAGAYAASRDDKDNTSSKPTETTQSSQTTRAADLSKVAPGSVVSEKTQTYAQHRPGNDATKSRSTAPTTTQSRDPERDDHTARNVALGGGATAATGAGAYALSQDRDRNEPQSVVSDQTQSYAGSRPTDTTTTALPTRSAAPVRESQPRQPEQDGHTARNAALGAGGLTGAGAGAYALSRNERDTPSNTDTDNVQSVVSPETQKYHRSHPSDNNSDLRSSATSVSPSQSSRSNQPVQSSQADPSRQTRLPEDDHTARNAALGAGGLAAGGAGAYALSRNDRDTSSNNDTGNSQSVVSPETQKYAGSHPSDATTAYQSSTMTSTPSSQTQPTLQSQQPREEDHTARNAALGAGGIGVAGAGAYALSNRDQDTAGNSQSVVSPETQKYAGSHPLDTASSYQPSGTTTGSTSQSQVPSSSYQQPRGEDHTARNAAIGAGGIGVAGAGAYALSRDNDNTGDPQSVVSPETQKYHGSSPESAQTTQPTSFSRAAEPTSYSRPTQSTAYDGSAKKPQEEDHTARNAALGAAGVGAAGAGAYALSRDDEQNRNAPQFVTSPETQGHAGSHPQSTTTTTTTTTTQGPIFSQSRVYGRPTERQDDYTTESAALGAGSATGIGSRSTARPQQEDHTARNAALGAGGAGAAGAAGYGAYQYANREPPPQQPMQQYPPQQQQQYAPPPQEKYKEPKAEKVKETKDTHQKELKHEKEPKYEKEQHRPEEYEHDPRVIAGSDGHNKLHKKGVDPEQYDGDHTGRNAALGVGTAGAAGAAGYGVSQYYNDKPDSQATSESQEGEKKHGFMHKILHPREHKREKEEEELRRSSDNRRSYEQPASSAVPPTVATGPSSTDPSSTGQARDGSVIEPHTGLPMNVSKYGPGQGGTDGSNTIEGFHETGPIHGNVDQTGRQY